MKQYLRQMIAATPFLALAVLLTGCPGPAPDHNAPSSNNSSGTGSQFRAALALDIAGVDDKSFNAASWSGMQRAQRELALGSDGVKYVEAKDTSDYRTNLQAFASQGYNLVFCGSYAFTDAMKEVGPQFAGVKFAIIDGAAPSLPNCTAFQFRSEQATFLAGYLAASMSKTKTIGFVGGKDIPIIKRFEAGYRAGAKAADPAVKVITTYTGDWNDVSKGKSQANQEFGNGADIVFHAAGKAGLGVIAAAKDKGSGFYAIGVDMDQDGVAPGRVLTSVLKRVDVAVYDTIKRTKENRFTSGNQFYGLKEGGVGLSEMKYTKSAVPALILSRLDKLTKMIEDGNVVVPTTVEAVASFQPPKF